MAGIIGSDDVIGRARSLAAWAGMLIADALQIDMALLEVIAQSRTARQLSAKNRNKLHDDGPGSLPSQGI